MRDNTPSLENFSQIDLPEGAVQDGEVGDEAMLVAGLRDLFAKQGKLRNVCLAVANQKVIARIIDLPYMAEDELRGAIRYQVQEFIPIPVESAVLDFEILEEYEAGNGERMMKLLVVAAQKTMVEGFVRAMQKAGVTPASIDFTPLALVRSIGGGGGASGKGQAGDAEALIDVGEEVTSMIVHEAGVPRLVRVLPFGASGTTDMLVDQISESADYYLGQEESRRIVSAVLSGDSNRLKELQPSLEKAIGAPVVSGACLSRMKTSPNADTAGYWSQMESSMAVSVGAALGVL